MLNFFISFKFFQYFRISVCFICFVFFFCSKNVIQYFDFLTSIFLLFIYEWRIFLYLLLYKSMFVWVIGNQWVIHTIIYIYTFNFNNFGCLFFRFRRRTCLSSSVIFLVMNLLIKNWVFYLIFYTVFFVSVSLVNLCIFFCFSAFIVCKTYFTIFVLNLSLIFTFNIFFFCEK